MRDNKMQIDSIGLLGVAFIILKLTGIINWAWIWVLAPFWGGLVIAITILIVCLIIALIVGRK